MTHPQNPEKKHRTLRKATARLDARIKDFESTIATLPAHLREGYHRPGSRQIRSR